MGEENERAITFISCVVGQCLERSKMNIGTFVSVPSAPPNAPAPTARTAAADAAHAARPPGSGASVESEVGRATQEVRKLEEQLAAAAEQSFTSSEDEGECTREGP